MKELKTEVRLWLAEKLLMLCLDIAPKDSKDGKTMRLIISEYFIKMMFKESS